MEKLKPWYKIVTPREDLREGCPLDASEFAVHLDKVRLGTAPREYSVPERFFDRTYLTATLCNLAGEAVRRLSGETTETSAVFNMTTQLGGGKTHALTLLYHLAKGGHRANGWRDVPKILQQSGIGSIPENCAVACFIGTEFDSITGRGGNDGTPLRRTPWGEIAFQLGGTGSFSAVADHDAQFTEPKGDAIQAFMPQDRPVLILMDEIINYASTYRERGYHNRLYNFLQSLSETVRGMTNAVLVVSIPASELAYTDRDESDQQRFKNLLDRVGKLDVCREYAGWITDHRQQLPQWFPIDHTREIFESTYPFHPSVLSVFERKWQELPRFQQTRGILRLLALWVSSAYSRGFTGAHQDLMIGLGSAPLDDPTFRAAVFEQLGETKLEGALTTDICGKKESHAIRLDAEADEILKKTQIHKKVATVIFLESNGGQSRNLATIPEIRLGVADPNLDLVNVETALDALTDACYYLNVDRNQYRFSLKENLNKRYADRRASIDSAEIEKLVREEIQKVFAPVENIERVFFPDKSAQILDRPALSFVILGPESSRQESPATQRQIEAMTREHGSSARTYKSALVWIVPETAGAMREEARKYLAWQDIKDEGFKLDDAQQNLLEINIKKAKRELQESVWRSYKNVFLLGKDNSIQLIDLGVVTSSAAESLTRYILNVLWQSDEIVKEYSARNLVKNWPPAFTEWSTRSVRDVFYASPQFPRLVCPEIIKEMIARGVREGQLAYVGKAPDGGYVPFKYKNPLDGAEVEIAEDLYILKSEDAEKVLKPPVLTRILISPTTVHLQPGSTQTFAVRGLDQFGKDMEVKTVRWEATGGQIDFVNGLFEAGPDEGTFTVTAQCYSLYGNATVTITITQEPPPPPLPALKNRLAWSGEVPPQKWMNLYTKVVTRFVKEGTLALKVSIEATNPNGYSEQQQEEIKAAFRELGLDDRLKID